MIAVDQVGTRHGAQQLSGLNVCGAHHMKQLHSTSVLGLVGICQLASQLQQEMKTVKRHVCKR